MSQINVHLGEPSDVAAAVSVYEHSNLARRHGDWPSRSSRVAQVTAKLHDPASWFLIGGDGNGTVAMAHITPFRASGGTGSIIPDAAFLNLLYVLPERWGEGIGGLMLDAVIDEADKRGCRRIYLWTHEDHNERAHRLYQSRRFDRTGHTSYDDKSTLIGEWLRVS